MTNLTTQDVEMIASLGQNQAYHKLLEILESSIDVVASELLRSSGKAEKKLLAYWRALRHVTDVLTETPQSMQEVLNIVPDEPLADEFKRNVSNIMEAEKVLEMEKLYRQWMEMDKKNSEEESL